MTIKAKNSKWIMIIIQDPKDSFRHFYRIQSGGHIDSSWMSLSDANNRLKELQK